MIDQYLDIYTNDFPKSSGPLQQLRDRAYEEMKKDNLNLPKEFEVNYGINTRRMNIQVDAARSFRCDVPGVSTLFAVVANDIFIPSKDLDTRLPKGVTYMSLAKANDLYPTLLQKYYGTIAPLDNPEVALNTLMTQDGVVIHVDKGVKLEKPLQLVNIFSSPVEMMSFRRLLIVLEEDAEASFLVCDHTQDIEKAYLSSQVTEIMLQPRAKLQLCTLEESSLKTTKMARVYTRQMQDSSLNFTAGLLTCGNSHNYYHVDLNETECHSKISAMVIGSEQMKADIETCVNHNSPKCKSDQLLKYVLSDKAKGSFKGKILVAPHAQYTEAYQSNRNILASEGARMHAEPALEIYNDDVKCSHGAATGRLNEEALFYMQSRGIPVAEARKMLMQAFMTDIIDTVEIPGLRERLHHLVERRFSGEAHDCATCKK